MILRLLIMGLAFYAVLYFALPPMTEAMATEDEPAHVLAARARSLQESAALRAAEAPAQRARQVHQSAVGLESTGQLAQALRQHQLAAQIIEDAYGADHPLAAVYRSSCEALEAKMASSTR